MRTKLPRPFQYSLSFMFLALLGGMLGGLFYGLGQESKFRCGKCNAVFFSHTTVSRIFFILTIITYTAVLALVASAIWGSHGRR